MTTRKSYFRILLLHAMFMQESDFQEVFKTRYIFLCNTTIKTRFITCTIRLIDKYD